MSSRYVQGTAVDSKLPWNEWVKTRHPSYRDQLVKHFLPFARTLAAKAYATRTHDEVPFDDYFQLASMGLLESIDRFDPQLGCPFRVYAAKRITGSILNSLELQTETTQQIAIRHRLHKERVEQLRLAKIESDAVQNDAPHAQSRPSKFDLFQYLAEIGVGIALGVLLEDTGMIDHDAFHSATYGDSPEVSYFRKNSQEILQKNILHALQKLPPIQCRVLRLHYFQSMSFTEMALRFNLSRGRLAQIHREALSRLAELLDLPAAYDL